MNTTYSESGMVRAAWVRYRAFSRELPPEIFSRDGRVTPLQVASVIALLSAPFWRIVGGTAEGMPFVPNVGMNGFFCCLFPEESNRAAKGKNE
jgi:hypothetical protein